MYHDIHLLLGWIAGLLSLSAFIAYYITIVNGKTIPNKATWLILTVVGVLVSTSYYSVGAKETIWVSVSYVIGPLIAFLLSIKYGESNWTILDKICLSTSVASLFIWWFSESAITVLLINILIDFLGIIPTIRKSYVRPETENYMPWLITTVASFLNILAIQDWLFSIYIYPIYMVIFNTIITIPLFIFKFRTFFK
jgi:hypothetical protein